MKWIHEIQLKFTCTSKLQSEEVPQSQTKNTT